MLFRGWGGERRRLSRGAVDGGYPGCAGALHLPEQRLRDQVGDCVWMDRPLFGHQILHCCWFALLCRDVREPFAWGGGVCLCSRLFTVFRGWLELYSADSTRIVHSKEKYFGAIGENAGFIDFLRLNLELPCTVQTLVYYCYRAGLIEGLRCKHQVGDCCSRRIALVIVWAATCVGCVISG